MIKFIKKLFGIEEKPKRRPLRRYSEEANLSYMIKRGIKFTLREISDQLESTKTLTIEEVADRLQLTARQVKKSVVFKPTPEA